MVDSKELWDKCLTHIESNVSKANFNTWFKNTSIMKEDGGVIFIGVPNEFVKDWLKNKFHHLITETLLQFASEVRAVEYSIAKIEKMEAVKRDVQKILMNRELPLGDLYINKEDNLNPRYTFESFVVGPFNELAHAAAQAVASRPGVSYNPFFIYGDTGLGKTHLLQSVGNYIKKHFPEKKVYYTTLEKFAIDYINSIQTNKANVFKEKYRRYDVLIIDDIQFVGKMEKTQEELFHLFNALYEQNKQIIFSSDKHPNFLNGLEDRLRSRFSAGMIVDIREPEYESRFAILSSKIKDLPIEISDEIINYIAESIHGNVRELEGCLNSVICHAQLKQKSVSLSEIKNLLKNNIKPKKAVVIRDVVKAISDFYNIEENSIYEKTRRKEIVHARQLVMYILREDFNVSYPLIGQKLGGKDHTTVIHSYLKIKNDLTVDPGLVNELEQLRVLFR